MKEWRPIPSFPDNLAWGDFYDNAADRKRNGRYATGAAHHNFVGGRACKVAGQSRV